MRAIRYSQTFRQELVELLAQGIDRFGVAVVAEKRALVYRAIQDVIALYPIRPVDPIVGLCAYPVSRTPFVLLYDYDDEELRMHVIIHGGADRSLIDLSTIVW